MFEKWERILFRKENNLSALVKLYLASKIRIFVPSAEHFHI